MFGSHYHQRKGYQYLTMTPQEAIEIKQKAQRESILIDAVVETDAVIENGTTFYYMYKQGLPYLTIEVVEKRVNNSEISTG